MIYGDRAALRMVDPNGLVLLKKNARYMKKSTFDQLANNVAEDGMLSSVPLCHEMEDARLEVLSGNHRVKAAIKAGLATILVLVIPQQVADAKIAKQLSHNAIVGLDDMQLLAELWSEIRDLSQKCYSGLDSETVAELEKIKFSGFSAEAIRTEKIVLWFLPEEVEDLDKLLEESLEVVSANKIYMAPQIKYDRLFSALVKVKKLRDIKNTAVALMWLIERFYDAARNAECAESIDSDAADDQSAEAGASPD